MSDRVGVIGCGAILRSHVNAIASNDSFELVSLCDIQKDILDDACKRYAVAGYSDYREMVRAEALDLVTIATPNSLHMEQAEFCIEQSCDVLIEKPATLVPTETLELAAKAEQCGAKAYCVLQVRLNPAVQVLRETLKRGLLGKIRGASLVQRWQRPLEYLTGWRAVPHVGGGTLHECGIHYLDVMGYLLGYPSVLAAKAHSVKHRHSEIEDTIYSLFDFGDFGGTMEVTIAAEPHNLECSLSVLGSNGYIKLGGKAMNVIETSNFLSNASRVEFENMLRLAQIPNKPNLYGSYAGSCPNHTELYASLPEFEIAETYPVLNLIDEIYEKTDKEYPQ